MTSCHLSHYIIELNLFVSSFSLRSFFSVFKAESFFSWPNSICLSNILKHVRACTLYYHTFFSLNSYLLCMATWCLIQGQSAHLHFILESWFPLVSGADLGANADEHVASANKRSRPLLPLVQTWGLILVPTVVFLFDVFLWDQNIFEKSFASHLSAVSHRVDAAVQKSRWPWQKKPSSANTPAC